MARKIWIHLAAVLALLACMAPAAARHRHFHADGVWTIHGVKNTVELNERNLAMYVRAGGTTWKMTPSSDHDMLIGFGGDRFWLSLAAAGSIRIEPYETGFKSGIRMTLGGFRGAGQVTPGAPLDLRLILTLCLEGEDYLVAEAMVNEGAAAVKL